MIKGFKKDIYLKYQEKSNKQFNKKRKKIINK